MSCALPPFYQSRSWVQGCEEMIGKMQILASCSPVSTTLYDLATVSLATNLCGINSVLCLPWGQDQHCMLSLLSPVPSRMPTHSRDLLWSLTKGNKLAPGAGMRCKIGGYWDWIENVVSFLGCQAPGRRWLMGGSKGCRKERDALPPTMQISDLMFYCTFGTVINSVESWQWSWISVSFLSLRDCIYHELWCYYFR